MFRSLTTFSIILISAVCILFTAPVFGQTKGFHDDSGRMIKTGRVYERIISLYAAHTENLYSLGLDERIVGVSTNEDFPENALTKPTFSYRDDPEKFIAARPDLVLIRPMIFNGYRRLISRLQDAGIMVVSLQPSTVDDMFEYWRRLGMLTGREKQAKQMIETFTRELNSVLSLTSVIKEKKKVYFESIHSKMKTFSPTAVPVFALESAGGINIAADAKPVHNTNIAAYGKERILSHASEIDVYLAQKGVMNKVSIEQIRRESGFGAIKAVREDRIYIVDERLVSRPTMRLLKGINEIAKVLYPDKFSKTIEEQSQ